MIRFVKIFNSKITGYLYFPENKKAPEMIEINTKTGDVDVVVESTLDQELGYPIYANKAKSYVKGYLILVRCLMKKI